MTLNEVRAAVEEVAQKRALEGYPYPSSLIIEKTVGLLYTKFRVEKKMTFQKMKFGTTLTGYPS